MAGVDVVLLPLPLWIILVSLTSGCYINECICWDAKIICETTDEASPYFTVSERFEANVLYLTQTQVPWITEKCSTFPRITDIVMTDGSECPQQDCAPCRRP